MLENSNCHTGFILHPSGIREHQFEYQSVLDAVQLKLGGEQSGLTEKQLTSRFSTRSLNY